MKGKIEKNLKYIKQELFIIKQIKFFINNRSTQSTLKHIDALINNINVKKML